MRIVKNADQKRIQGKLNLSSLLWSNVLTLNAIMKESLVVFMMRQSEFGIGHRNE